MDGQPPVATVNRFGRGQAIYVATPAQPSIMAPIYRALYAELGIVRGPNTPAGVYARVVDGRTLYVNTTGEPKDIALGAGRRGVLSDQSLNETLRLGPWGVEVVE